MFFGRKSGTNRYFHAGSGMIFAVAQDGIRKFTQMFAMRVFLLYTLFFVVSVSAIDAQRIATARVSDPAGGSMFRELKGAALPRLVSNRGTEASTLPAITISMDSVFQSIDGYGYALTGGSAQHLLQMSKAARTSLLKQLFDTTGDHIGTSYLRVSVGASDLNDHVFSYDDLPAGETDTALAKFNLGPDLLEVIPVLKEILAISPNVKIMGSPWSPPTWMKDNQDTRGGSLLFEYYPAYARYLARYIREMEKQGIHLESMTVQNEPLHPGNNPSMLMKADSELIFVRDHLGPEFRRQGIHAKIIIYDHNADRPDYPISILQDSVARQYIDGSAFHLYGGKIEALSEVHHAFPQKNLYFTEQWVGAPGNMKRDLAEHTRKLTIGAMRNWSKTVIEWNLAADSLNNPHTDRGGCDRCLGAVTIDGDNVKYNPAYYIIAHAARYIRPGSVRITSNVIQGLPNVAFITPRKQVVLLVLNDGKLPQQFAIKLGKKSWETTLASGAVGTFVIQ